MNIEFSNKNSNYLLLFDAIFWTIEPIIVDTLDHWKVLFSNSDRGKIEKI